MIGTTPQSSKAELFVMTPQGDLMCWRPMDGDALVGPTVVQQAELDDELVTELRMLAGLLVEMHAVGRVIGGNLHGLESNNDGAGCQ